jgi:hypothetical protein
MGACGGVEADPFDGNGPGKGTATSGGLDNVAQRKHLVTLARPDLFSKLAPSCTRDSQEIGSLRFCFEDYFLPL